MRSVQNQNRELLLITVLQHTNSQMPFHAETFCYCVLLLETGAIFVSIFTEIHPHQKCVRMLVDSHGCTVLIQKGPHFSV